MLLRCRQAWPLSARATATGTLMKPDSVLARSLVLLPITVARRRWDGKGCCHRVPSLASHPLNLHHLRTTKLPYRPTTKLPYRRTTMCSTSHLPTMLTTALSLHHPLPQ